MSDEPAPEANAVREVGGRYALGRRLGAGSQGTTFEAVDKLDGRPVAIKEFRVKGAESWKDVELAEREAKVLRTLDHPNLPAFIAHFEENGCLYLVMELVEGETLRDLQKRGDRLTESDVVRFLQDAGSVLDYLHDRAPPIIHRDVKPGNVIRRRDGSFALVDFGAVRDDLKPEGGSTVVGTFGYMAPEQFQGRASPATDVYAVGATAMTLLAGRPPEELPHRGLRLDVSATLGTRVHPRLVAALTRMLDPDPDQRATRIGPLLAGLEPSTPPKPRTRRPAPDGIPERPPVAPPPHAWAPLVFGIFQLVLTVAQVAVAVALLVVVPTLLTLLSLVISPRLRLAASAVRRAGHNATRAIHEARSGHLPPRAVRRQRRQRRRRRRVRTEHPERLRVSSFDGEPLEDAAEEERVQQRRGRDNG